MRSTRSRRSTSASRNRRRNPQAGVGRSSPPTTAQLLEALEPRTLLSAAYDLVPAAPTANVFEQGGQTVIQVLAGSVFDVDVRVAATGGSTVEDFQLNFGSSALGGAGLSIANWIPNATDFTAGDDALDSADADIFVTGAGGAVTTEASLGALTVNAPSATGSYKLSIDSSTVFTGTLYDSMFINRLEELIESDPEFIENVEAEALAIAADLLGGFATVTALSIDSIDILAFDGVDTAAVVGPNIHKFNYVWNPNAAGGAQLLLGARTEVATTAGANGILLKDGFLYVGGQTNEVYKVDIATGAVVATAVLPADTESFHIAFNQDETAIITTNQPDSKAAIVPLADFGVGVTGFDITGADTLPDEVTQVAFAPELTAVNSDLAYYTASNRFGIDPETEEDGHFGIIDLSTNTTTRLFDSKAHHSIKYDPHTGDLFTFGNRFVRQYDITDPENPTLKSELDLTAFLADLPDSMNKNLFVDAQVTGTVSGTIFGVPASTGFDELFEGIDTSQQLNVIDQGVPDGFGNLYLATNSGHMVALSVIGVAGDLIENAIVYAMEDGNPPLIDRYLDDFAPIVDPSVVPDSELRELAGAIDITSFGDLMIEVVDAASVSASVFNDTDTDGTRGGGETGIADVTAAIYRDVNDDGQVDGGDTLVDTALSAADGTFSFTSLLPGNYLVDLTDDANQLAGLANTAALPPAAITVAAGEDITGPNFGFAVASAEITIDAGDDLAEDIGQLVEVLASFTNTNAAAMHTAVIDWGDGSANTAGLVIEPMQSTSGDADIQVLIDYSLDANNFFDTDAKKDVLQLAADTIVNMFGDALTAITPGGTDTWTAQFNNPATGALAEIVDRAIPENVIVVYAGGRALAGSTLGIGGIGGATGSSFSQDFFDAVFRRGQDAADDMPPTDFARWGGAITFDSTANWHFDETADGLDNDEEDFFSVALHEMMHLLGFGTAPSWDALITGGLFTGAASAAEYDLGGSVPVSGDQGHWADDTNDNGAETAMDPTILQGTRKTLTALDIAGLDDIGWDILASSTTPGSITGNHVYAAPGDYTVTITVTDDEGNMQSDDIVVSISGTSDASIGDFVYDDSNNNGAFDAGETGIQDVTLDLYIDENEDGQVDAGDTHVASAFTDDTGAYDFAGLMTGEYLVEVDVGSAALAGFATTTGAVVGVSLADAEDFNDADFGFFMDVAPGSIAGVKFLDANNNGAFDAGEATSPGVTIYLDTNNNGVLDDGETSTVTNEQGGYIFSDLAPGDYRVAEVTPDGQIQTAPTAAALLAPENEVQDPPVVSDGYGFATFSLDVATNELFFTVDFAGLEGDTTLMHIHQGTPSSNGPVLIDLIAAAGVEAGFTSPVTGSIVISTQQLAAIQTGATYVNLHTTAYPGGELRGQVAVTNDHLVTVAAGEDVTGRNFGNADEPVQTGSIGDTVFSDDNANGTLDGGELGITGVTVDLYLDVDGDGTVSASDQFIATQATDVDGAYDFQDLLPAQYVVDVTDTDGVLAGFTFTTANDPLGVTLAEGQDFNDAVFGYQLVAANDASIGDFVFNDLNGNGQFDEGEPGIPGVTLALFVDTNSDGLLDAGDIGVTTATTDDNGFYLFAGLAAGDFIVDVTDIDGVLTEATLTAGSGPAAVTLGETDEQRDVDFGYLFPDQPIGAIGDMVFLDANGNALPDDGELGIANVTVDLHLDLDDDGLGDQFVATATTDDDGMYLFQGLPAGAYVVTVTDTNLALLDLAPTRPEVTLVSLAEDQQFLVADFGYATPQAELPVITVTADDAQASEAGPVVGRFIITRTGSTDLPLDVDYAVGGTAESDVDYATLAGTATIPAGSDSVEIFITPIDDDAEEDDETVTVTLSESADYVIGDISTDVVTIADDDASEVEVLVIGKGEDAGTKAELQDAQGNMFRFQINGDGLATILRDATTGKLSIRIDGATDKTKLIVKALSGAEQAINNIEVTSGLKQIKAKGVAILGDVIVTGPLTQLILGAVADQHIINVGGVATDKAMNVRVESMQNVTFISGAPIKNFIVDTAWIDSDEVADRIEAPAINKVLVKAGNLEAGLVVSGEGVAAGKAAVNQIVVNKGTISGASNIDGDVKTVKADSIASDFSAVITGELKNLTVKNDASGNLQVLSASKYNIKGNLVDATYRFTQSSTASDAAKNIIVKGAVTDSQLISAGIVNNVKVGSMMNANLFAGLDPDRDSPADLPATDDAILNGSATINKLTITGQGAVGSAFANSNIAAAALGKVDLKTVQIDNGDQPFGLFARSVDQLKAQISQAVSLNLNNPTPADIDLLQTDDFDIRLV